ncbi:glutamate decarboxylase [Lactococcus insecticola]|uniref:Glutamate decarboxylase n=1 Tax=Pseudolactococcus insecticola TaxID=2709158 RepID=A0A6A0B6Y8_9LACT|nr:glutamate decarboxylase [Lactococcus insecticola]GFH40535.1 glutamate decarboxylase beta [Lactococcus insecticola]
MLYGKNDQSSQSPFLQPIFGSDASKRDIPKYKLATEPIEPRIAYQLIKDELLDEGVARQNLATFCQTYMEPEATQLMGETLAKNAIDKSEYPRTAELENRCVNMIADLWHAPDSEAYMGTSTVGSSEACMLGGMAMKFRWRKRAKSAGIDIQAKRPNLVISSGYQVCWEKFAVYFDVELREVPMTAHTMSLDLSDITSYFDDYTIGVVGILGITYTGVYDDIAALDAILTQYNATAKLSVPIHVDAASGGMYTPFMEPEIIWDFQLKNVASINTSGHKYGLVYPGIGWIIWRDKTYLPEELIFSVSYLGGDMPTMAINFSRSASQIIGQFYNFMRFGFNGYKEIHQRTHDVAVFLAKTVADTGYFTIYNAGEHLPIICYKLKDDAAQDWTLYELADVLQMKGWQVPAYPLPNKLSDTVIQRYVVRADFGMNVAEAFAEDFRWAIDKLNQSRFLRQKDDEKRVQGFTH